MTAILLFQQPSLLNRALPCLSTSIMRTTLQIFPSSHLSSVSEKHTHNRPNLPSFLALPLLPSHTYTHYPPSFPSRNFTPPASDEYFRSSYSTSICPPETICLVQTNNHIDYRKLTDTAILKLSAETLTFFERIPDTRTHYHRPQLLGKEADGRSWTVNCRYFERDMKLKGQG